jgi:N-acyl-D-aspartate/D-glutamate deacylase
MNRVFLAVLAAIGVCVAGCTASPAAQAPAYDLLIRNGRVVDGTGNPWFPADVAIKDGKITAVGRVTGTASRTIDATGLVVAPGFIDLHTHSDMPLLNDGNAES